MALNITKNINHKFNSCYRPIITEIEDTNINTAFLRGELYSESVFGSNVYQPTGILINAYESKSGTGLFRFNLMEYTRHFMDDSCIFDNVFTFPSGDNLSTRFKFIAWSVVYDPSNPGILIDDLNNSVTTNVFAVIPTITKEDEATGISNNYISVDSFVLGFNSSNTSPNNHKFLTNLPSGHTQYVIGGEGIRDSIYIPVKPNSSYPNFSIKYTDVATGNYYEVNPSITANMSIFRAPIHPLMIEFLALINGVSAGSSAAGSGLFYSGGGLTSKEVKIEAIIWNTTSSVNTEVKKIKYVDKTSCNKTKFIFKNMRGGYDWFDATGTENKGVSVSGKTFDKYVSYTGEPRGSHGTSNLWTERTDSYSVFSQPLTKEYATWIEELITSPTVWIEKSIENPSTASNSILLPIMINKGSYKTYTTEDGVHFIEFKYTLSNNIGTQRN